MRRFSLLFFVAVSTIMLLSSCGRDSLSRQCTSSQDCGAGQLCEDGFCVDTTPNSTNNTNNLNSTNNTNNTNNINNIQCESNDDCPTGQVCDVMSGVCAAGQCIENDQGGCVIEGTETPCAVGCSDFEEQVGCSCVAVGCMTNDECGDFICVGGECQACTSSEECDDDEACTDDGRCIKDESCRVDEDCDPAQECRGGMCLDRPECLLDDDCDADEICIGGTCTFSPECTTDDDCGENFECIGDRCFEKLCRGPLDCPEGLLCDAGECVEPPPAVFCFVATPDSVILPGQSVPLEAFALDSDGNGVAATFTWSTSNAAAAAVDASGRNAVGGVVAGVASLTAILNGGDPVMCQGTADLTNPGPAVVGGLRVTVVNAENGSAVAGANVSAGSLTGMTDATGIANLMQPAGNYDLTVRHPDYNWVTIQNIGLNDVRISVLPKSGSGPAGGFTGEFDTSLIGSNGQITVGLAGASLTGGLLELDLTRILGEPFVTPISIPGIGGQTFPIPGGLIAYGGAFGFNLDIKKKYYTSTSGGAKLAWGLAGRVPIQDLIGLVQGGGGGANVISTILPLFNRFDHGSLPLNVAALPRVVDTMDIDGDGNTTEVLPDYDAFPTVTLRPSVRQTLASDVAVSNFPQLPGGQGELAILVGGTLLNAPGLVPLGISATADEDGDGRPDTRRLSIAPPAGSLAGGRYSLVAIAFRTDGLGANFNFPPNMSVALWNGQSFPSGISLGTFPDQSFATINTPQRTIAVQADAGPLYRVRMVGANRTWDVWTAGPAGVMGSFTHTITIPPSAGPGDFFVNGDILLDAIQTNASIEAIVRSNGVGLTNVGLVSTAFNRTQIQ